ncbi:MAG: hypothetical protein FWH35_03205, partial [Treponema sp.]|nr:hypothetical protein [Treponema sp.]
LAKITSDLTSSGFGNVKPETTKKLKKYSDVAGKLGLKEGKHLIDNLIEIIKAINAGKSKAESGNLRLIALNFYLLNLPNSELIEDL